MSHLEDHLHIVALAESSDSVVHIRWARRWDEVVVLQREKLESEKIEKKQQRREWIDYTFPLEQPNQANNNSGGARSARRELAR